MKVFVAGATGAIGKPAVAALVAAGHQVMAIARTEKKAAALTKLGATPVAVSLFDRSELTRALAGHDTVVNLATSIPPSSKLMDRSAWAANDRVRTEGSATLVDAALAAGVRVFVQESVCMLYRDSGEAWVDEATPTDTFPMALGNHAAEASANRFTDAGGNGIVLRFGWFYGPTATHSREFFDLARRRGIGIMFGAAKGYVSSIHVDDGGAAVAASLSAPAGTYNVVDDEPLTKSAYAVAIGHAAGRAIWLKAPGGLAYLLGHRTTSLTRSLRVSNKHFRQTTEWRPSYPSAREGWLATGSVLARA